MSEFKRVLWGDLGIIEKGCVVAVTLLGLFLWLILLSGCFHYLMKGQLIGVGLLYLNYLLYDMFLRCDRKLLGIEIFDKEQEGLR